MQKRKLCSPFNSNLNDPFIIKSFYNRINFILRVNEDQEVVLQSVRSKGRDEGEWWVLDF